jgi:hypothetical protein
MIRSILQLSLSYFYPKRSGELVSDPERYDRWVKQVRDAMKPFAKDYTGRLDFPIDLDSPKLNELTGVLDQLKKDKIATVSGDELTQRLVEDKDTRIEWFELADARAQAH